jgi:hypothetical protein
LYQKYQNHAIGYAYRGYVSVNTLIAAVLDACENLKKICCYGFVRVDFEMERGWVVEPSGSATTRW